MLKPFVLSIGIYLCILGGECLILDKAIMASETEETPPQQVGILNSQLVAEKKEITPSGWAPWSLLSVGAVVIMYSASMHRGD